MDSVVVSNVGRGLLNQHDGVRDGACPFADSIESFVGGCLDRYRTLRDANSLCNSLAHQWHMGSNLGAFEDDGCINIDRPVAMLAHEHRDVSQQQKAGDVAIPGVRIGEMNTNVTKCHRAKQRITDRMQQNVCVGVPLQAHIRRDLNATQDKRSSMDEAMRIVAEAHALSRQVLISGFQSVALCPVVQSRRCGY